MHTASDAIVVGAGPAGSAVATLLARRGWRVRLFDAATFPRQKVCGECLAPSAWEPLELVGAAAAVRKVAQPLERVELVVHEKRRLCAATSADALRPHVAVSRFQLDALLVDIATKSGVELIEHCRIREPLIEQGRVVGVLAGAPHGPATAWKADVVIAADGRDSQIVRRTGRITRRGPDLVGFKRYLPPGEHPLADPRTLEMHSLAGGYVGVCQGEAGWTNVCGVVPRRLVARGPRPMSRLLTQWASARPGLLARLNAHDAQAKDHPSWWATPSVVTQRAKPRVPGVLYVGDACGTIEPLTGQGMSMALESAVVVAAWLADQGPVAADAPGQRAYDRAWKARFGRRVERACWLGRLLRCPNALAALAWIELWKRDAAARLFEHVFEQLSSPRRRIEGILGSSSS